MVLKLVRFISLFCAALIAGVAFCHVLELPNKMTLPAATWLNIQQVLYRGFGAKAGAIEVMAIVSTLTLLFLIDKRRISFFLTLVASVCFVAGLTIWFAMVAPINHLVDSWTVTSLPAAWMEARNQWEYGHATHATFFIVGLIALILALLADISTKNNHASFK